MGGPLGAVFCELSAASRIVCIDPFEGNVEHHTDPYFADLARKSEAQFDSNLAAFRDRVEKIKGSSTDILPNWARPAAGSISLISTAATARPMSIAMRC